MVMCHGKQCDDKHPQEIGNIPGMAVSRPQAGKGSGEKEQQDEGGHQALVGTFFHGGILHLVKNTINLM
jgi:hypothetical protein